MMCNCCKTCKYFRKSSVTCNHDDEAKGYCGRYVNKERFINWKKPKIKHGKLTKYNWLVLHPENLIMGNNVDIGAFSLLCCHFGIELGDNVQIGAGVKIYSLDTIDNRQGKVTIKENSCVGANSVILSGVIIGKNSIVGAMSLVTKDVPDNVIACGVPCKVIKKLSIVNKKIIEFPLPPSEKFEDFKEL